MNYLDINSLTEILRLSMLKNISSSDSTSTQTTDSQSNEIFELLLQEIIQNSGATSSNITSQPLVNNNLGISNNINNSTQVNNSGASNSTSASNGNEIDNAIQLASQKYGVDDAFIKAMVKQESGFHSNAVSPAGAVGLMQLMPKTAASLGVKNPFDVLENIDGGTKYIKKLMDSFGGNKELALSAYNGGISRMNKRGVNTVDKINNMPSETQNYVAKVMKSYESYKKA